MQLFAREAAHKALFCIERQLDDSDRYRVWVGALQERFGDVIDRNVIDRSAFRKTAVGVPVKDHVHRVAQQWLFQAAGAEKRKDFTRLAFYRGLDRRVM